MEQSYYKDYYNTKKHLYKLRYEERKIQKKIEEELFKPYGGKETYYKNKMIDFINIAKKEKVE